MKAILTKFMRKLFKKIHIRPSVRDEIFRHFMERKKSRCKPSLHVSKTWSRLLSLLYEMFNNPVSWTRHLRKKMPQAVLPPPPRPSPGFLPMVLVWLP